MQKVVKPMGNLDLIGIEDMEDLELDWVLVELCSLQLFINLFKLNYKLSFLSFFRLCVLSGISLFHYIKSFILLYVRRPCFLFFDFTDYFCFVCFASFGFLIWSRLSFLFLLCFLRSIVKCIYKYIYIYLCSYMYF